MGNTIEISAFGTVLLFIIGAVIFLMVMMGMSRLLRTQKPNEEKLSSYECGEEAADTAQGQFNSRFYVVALVFILFDVELLLLFPWATVFGDTALNAASGGLWAWFTLAEMGVFVALLALGLAFAWRKGMLDWVKPDPKIINYQSPVPADMYKEVNERYK